MKELYLIRAVLEIENLARWSAERGLVQRGNIVKGFDEGRALHHLLDELFGPKTIRPFRLLVSPGGHAANLYGYSKHSHKQLQEMVAIHGLPEHIKVVQPARLESKKMPSVWKREQRLGFDLRVRPVRRLKSTLENGDNSIRKGAELDAFLIEALRLHPKDKLGMANCARSRELVYLDWLEARFGGGAEIDRVATRLASFKRTCISRGSSGPEGPDVVFHGALAIKDPEHFKELLSRGIGRHRAYGYGMILLRPPNQKYNRENA